MIQFLLDNILGFVTNIALGIAYLFERRKRTTLHEILKEERKKDEITNEVSVMKYYQEALVELKKWNDERFSEMQAELDALKLRLKASQAQYAQLKKDFTEYKKNHE